MAEKPPKSLSKITLEPEKLRRMTLPQLTSFYAKLQTAYGLLEKKLIGETLPGFLEQVLTLQEEVKYWPTLRHIREWCSLVATENKLLVEASRDHFKSTFFSFGYPLYRVQKVRRIEEAFGIALFSYSESQSQKNLKRIRQEIENNPKLKWLMPRNKSSVWDSGTLDMSNGCYVESYGFGSSFRGRHPKLIIIDDPSKDEGSGTMSLDQQIQFFSAVIIPAAKKDSQVILTGNPVGKKDFLEWIEQNKAFKSFFYPVLGKDGQPLAPEHYNHAAIEDKRNTIPAHTFAREYLLQRVAAEDARFKEEWVRYYRPEDIAGKPIYKVMTIDPAMSPGGDNLAGVVTGCRPNPKGGFDVYILDVLLFRGEFQAGVSKMVDLMVAHYPDFIGFEEFAMQAMYKIWLQQEIQKRNLYFNIQSVGRDSKKKKSARIESLQPIMSQGRLHFLHEHRKLINQFLLWDPISKTNDDDGIDALAYQVPLWQGREDEAPAKEIQEGTFDQVILEMMKRNRQSTLIGRMFEDMGMA